MDEKNIHDANMSTDAATDEHSLTVNDRHSYYETATPKHSHEDNPLYTSSTSEMPA